jgi:hypothetical protein
MIYFLLIFIAKKKKKPVFHNPIVTVTNVKKFTVTERIPYRSCIARGDFRPFSRHVRTHVLPGTVVVARHIPVNRSRIRPNKTATGRYIEDVRTNEKKNKIALPNLFVFVPAQPHELVLYWRVSAAYPFPVDAARHFLDYLIFVFLFVFRVVRITTRANGSNGSPRFRRAPKSRTRCIIDPGRGAQLQTRRAVGQGRERIKSDSSPTKHFQVPDFFELLLLLLIFLGFFFKTISTHYYYYVGKHFFFFYVALDITKTYIVG